MTGSAANFFLVSAHNVIAIAGLLCYDYIKIYTRGERFNER